MTRMRDVAFGPSSHVVEDLECVSLVKETAVNSEKKQVMAEPSLTCLLIH